MTPGPVSTSTYLYVKSNLHVMAHTARRKQRLWGLPTLLNVSCRGHKLQLTDSSKLLRLSSKLLVFLLHMCLSFGGGYFIKCVAHLCVCAMGNACWCSLPWEYTMKSISVLISAPLCIRTGVKWGKVSESQFIAAGRQGLQLYEMHQHDWNCAEIVW